MSFSSFSVSSACLSFAPVAFLNSSLSKFPSLSTTFSNPSCCAAVCALTFLPSGIVILGTFTLNLEAAIGNSIKAINTC